VEFLRKLRQDLPARLHQSVEEVLRCLNAEHKQQYTASAMAPSESVINSCFTEPSARLFPQQLPPSNVPIFSAAETASPAYPSAAQFGHHSINTAAEPVQPMEINRPPNNPLPMYFRFDFIHLSVLDERWLADFVNIMRSSVDRDDLYDKFRWAFHIVCVDFGPQLFLQRPNQLLSVRMHNLIRVNVI
jgi:hypothetical protein